MKKISISIFLFAMGCLPGICPKAAAQPNTAPQPLRLGYSVSITAITPEKMQYAKSAGMDCIEVSGLTGLIDKDSRNFKFTDEAIAERVKKVKEAADNAGIEIWSIHMPFGKLIDLSIADEAERQQVVALHKKVLSLCRILRPKVVLFHPSYFLGLNEREIRKSQMIKSAIELNKTIKDMGAVMVIENMLGPAVLKDEKTERPLCRTVEETVAIMNRLPYDIYSAIDMNHITHPERLILAMGKRLKSVHIADGDGKAERHYFPCSGQGENNWTEILSALEEAGYTGPFMYESAYEDVKDMKVCYDSLYHKFIKEKSLKQ